MTSLEHLVPPPAISNPIPCDDLDDDSDVIEVNQPATPTAEPTPHAEIEPAAPLVIGTLPPEPEKPLMVFVTAEHQRVGAPVCRCGAQFTTRSGKFVIFEMHPGVNQQVCDDCAARDHDYLVPLLRDMNALDEPMTCSPPVLAVRPQFVNSGCGFACHGTVVSDSLSFVLRVPFPGQTLHEGKCRRCMTSRYPRVAAVVERFLGLAVLPPVAPPAPPPPPTEEQIAAAREARHRATLVDILTSGQAAWRGGTHYNPAAAAELLLKIIDERSASTRKAC